MQLGAGQVCGPAYGATTAGRRELYESGGTQPLQGGSDIASAELGVPEQLFGWRGVGRSPGEPPLVSWRASNPDRANLDKGSSRRPAREVVLAVDLLLALATWRLAALAGSNA